LWASWSELSADYRPAIGERRRIRLTNGTSLELNTQTSIAVRPPTNETDHIELISGEAAITTGQRLTRPLVVIVGDGQITSESASFNVRYDGVASCVACLEGAVRVTRDTSELTLSSRQQVAYAGRGLQSPVTIDPAVVTAWQDGLLIFHETAMSEVVAEVNRYRSGKIVLLNSDLGRRQVNARFRVGNVDEIISLAERVFGARITSLPGGIVLLS
jgi:transmembrane sensor